MRLQTYRTSLPFGDPQSPYDRRLSIGKSKNCDGIVDSKLISTSAAMTIRQKDLQIKVKRNEEGN
ncbi:MAG: hypothetical protein BHW39_07760 [Firmicutes bacterium CAG:552_39_19]|nr:MAG: hypothetical protein BHW39_07760 [Firmicutes bacterium CAG:552_39_19]